MNRVRPLQLLPGIRASWWRFASVASFAALLWTALDPASAQELGGRLMLEDFQSAQPGLLEPVTVWKWTLEERAAAAEYSSRAIVEEPGTGNRSLEVTMEPDIPAALFTGPFQGYPVWFLGDALVEPTADVVRFDVRVVEGVCRLSVGGPTVYFGNSDAFAAPVELSAGAGWTTVEMPLNRDLVRNFRRAGFSLQATAVHYTRWIQEPMSVILIKPGVSVRLQIDNIELISLGEGLPWPEFAPGQVERLNVAAGFEAPIDFGKAYTFTHFGADYQASWTEVNPTYKPPALNVISIPGEVGNKALEVRHRGLEERSFTGIRGLPPATANAVEIRMRVDHPGGFAEHSIDFLAYAAPAESRGTFPWDLLSYPPEEPAADGFDYDFSQQRLGSISHAFYHARRSVPQGVWRTLVIPFSEFAAAYGAGELRSRHLQQELLRPEEIFALGWTPSYRQRSGESRIWIDSVAFVRTPGTPASMQSFAQSNWSYGSSSPQPFDLWLEQWFPLATLNEMTLEPALWGEGADPDGDGLENFREHALGMGPFNSGSSPLVDGFLFEEEGIWYPAIRFRRDPSARDARYTVRVASDLDRWQPGHSYAGDDVHFGDGLTIEAGRAASDDGFEWVTVRSTSPVGGTDPPRGFLRLDVERQLVH